MKKANIYIYSYINTDLKEEKIITFPKYLSKCVEEEESDFTDDKKNGRYGIGLTALFKEIKKMQGSRGNEHRVDILNEIYQEEYYLDFDFAKSLQRFDIIYNNCFKFKSNMGEALIRYVIDPDIKFLVIERRWENSKLSIELLAVHCDNDIKEITYLYNTNQLPF